MITFYDLPFETGKKVLIHQGYDGKFSHQGENALDFKMPEGSKIFAARDGKIVEVVDTNSQNCDKETCAKFNNKITVMHSDGTFAGYLHLKQNGVVVKLGDVVKKGQLLGYSGNTGWSNGPHLHFSVFLNRMDGKYETIKTKFHTTASEPEFLQEKKSYLKNY